MKVHTWTNESIAWAHNCPSQYLGERSFQEFREDNRTSPELVRDVRKLEDGHRIAVYARGGTVIKTFMRKDK